jgi:hypothetical protein
MFFASFNSAEIIRVEIGLFRQPFLAQMKPLPLFADGGPEDNAIIRRRHSQTRKQSLPRLTTPLNG